MNKKVNLRLRLKISVAFVWIGALVALLSKVFGTWCLWLGLAIVVVATLCRLTLIRCPYCGFRLAEGKNIPPCCPSCGGEFEF
jgi:hypothetical protein